MGVAATSNLGSAPYAAGHGNPFGTAFRTPPLESVSMTFFAINSIKKQTAGNKPCLVMWRRCAFFIPARLLVGGLKLIFRFVKGLTLHICDMHLLPVSNGRYHSPSSSMSLLAPANPSCPRPRPLQSLSHCEKLNLLD